MCYRVIRPFIPALTGVRCPQGVGRRGLGMVGRRGVVKRLYREVEYEKQGSGYAVLLDSKPLKTPKGNRLILPSEGLAAVIAQEWSHQGEEIRPQFMHLNALACTVLDNPTSESNEDRVGGILGRLEADSVCLWTSEPVGFALLQKEKWGELIEWFNGFYGVSITPCIDKLLFEIPANSQSRLREILSQNNSWRLIGLQFCTDSCRSLIIASALMEGFLSCEQGVRASLLETDFQCGFWGRVEWGHGVDEAELMNRLAAAVVFIKACDY